MAKMTLLDKYLLRLKHRHIKALNRYIENNKVRNKMYKNLIKKLEKDIKVIHYKYEEIIL